MRRMPTYLHRLIWLRNEGEEWVSCADLAAYMNIPHILVRKDIAMTGLPGNKRYGFHVVDLINAILKFVGWADATTATLVGAGSLGSALLGFADFQAYNFRIETVFDASPQKVGTTIHGYTVFDFADIQKKLQNNPPKVGVICVPDTAAQTVANTLVSLGIKYIWNFANVCLKVPEDVIVQREVISGGLAVLSAKIKTLEEGDDIQPAEE